MLRHNCQSSEKIKQAALTTIKSISIYTSMLISFKNITSKAGAPEQKERPFLHHWSVEHASWSSGISRKSKPRDKPLFRVASTLETIHSTLEITQLPIPSPILHILNMCPTSCNREHASHTHSSHFFKNVSSTLLSSKDIFRSFEWETNSCKI